MESWMLVSMYAQTKKEFAILSSFPPIPFHTKPHLSNRQQPTPSSGTLAGSEST